ncbi:MAG: STAS domain-containing protein [Actinomycetota bacterium]|nr:STAS domain-containing protein [Actinomycetota bacterium]
MTPVVPRFELREESPDDRTCVINVRGEIHVSTAPEFTARLNDALESGKTAIVLDLTNVEFIDSTGLSVLLNGLRRVTRQDGRLALVCSNPTVLRLFEITRLDSTFDIFVDRGDAIAHVHAGASSAGEP